MASQLASDSIGPGPCAGGVCPPPSEIECIEVCKVYDLCFKPETVFETFTFTPDSDPPISCFCDAPVATSCPIGTTIPCRLGDATCSEVSRTPTGTEGFATVVLLISIPVKLYKAGTTPTGASTPCVTETIMLTRRVTLCAPEGTKTICKVSGTCDAMIAHLGIGPDGHVLTLDIQVSLDLCTVAKTVADVNLLVPAYGFCVPSECITSGLPGITCPPSPPRCVA